ncbi:MAG: hypothetical protein WCF67_11400 [Chitinophagaceae bacterium]
MAITNNPLLAGASGAIGKQLIVKNYGSRTVLSAYPDMSGIKPSREQKQKRGAFKEAVAYAQGILKDPAKKAAYKKGLKKGETVYHKAIKEYLKKQA